MTLEEQIEVLRQEIEDLREWVMRRPLTNTVNRLVLAGFTRNCAIFTAALYEARGHSLSRDEVEQLLPTRSGHYLDRAPKTVDVMLHRIRKILGKDAIKTIWGRGFMMTPTGIATVAKLVGG